MNKIIAWFKAVFADEDLYYRFLALLLAAILWFFVSGQGRFGSPGPDLDLDFEQEVRIEKTWNV